MISYYELLGMIKEGNIPKKIKVHLTPVSSRDYISEYDIDESFTYYRLENEKEENDDYRFCLADCYLETTALDETIEILDEKKIGKIHWKSKESLEGDFNSKEKQDILARRTERLKKSINEIIDLLNKEE